MDALYEVIAELRTSVPGVAGVGVGLPGFVDSVNGIVHHLTNVEGWEEVPLARLLTEATRLPAIVENDVKAMTYGEWKHGAARGVQHAVCITLGTGVGGGLSLAADCIAARNSPPERSATPASTTADARAVRKFRRP